MRLLKDNICPFLGNLFPFSTIPLSMWFNVRVLHDICVWAEGTLVADVLIVLRQPPHSLRFPSRQILFMGAEKYTSPEEGNTKVWPTCPACWSPVLVSHGSPTSASICHLWPPPLPREAPPSSLEGSFSFQAVAREPRMDEIWWKKIQILNNEEIWFEKNLEIQWTIGSRFAVNNSSESKQLSPAASLIASCAHGYQQSARLCFCTVQSISYLYFV